jgi:hypothetical protein
MVIMVTFIQCFVILDLLTNILMAILIQYLLNFNILTCILTNIDVVNILCKIWTLGLGIWENNWATMCLSTYYQIFIKFLKGIMKQ